MKTNNKWYKNYETPCDGRKVLIIVDKFNHSGLIEVIGFWCGYEWGDDDAVIVHGDEVVCWRYLDDKEDRKRIIKHGTLLEKEYKTTCDRCGTAFMYTGNDINGFYTECPHCKADCRYWKENAV